MSVYESDIALALELVQEFGTQVTWEQTTTVLYDPSKPWLGGIDTTLQHSPYLCFVPATGGDYGMGELVDDTTARGYRTFALMGQQSFTPALADRVVRGDKTLALELVNELKPADDVILYIFGLKE